MATATHKTPQSSSKKSAKKNVKRASAEKSDRCWPGFEPVSGKRPGTKGSCERVPGTHSDATRRATQKAAAASKLQKQQ
jgi:hypothetical protein